MKEGGTIQQTLNYKFSEHALQKKARNKIMKTQILFEIIDTRRNDSTFTSKTRNESIWTNKSNS